jgi:hypothetical protein
VVQTVVELVTEEGAKSVVVRTTGATRAVLNRCIAAVQVESRGTDTAKAGVVRQLHPGMKLAVCGSGFSAQTVKVRCDDGGVYFVFAEDLLYALPEATIFRQTIELKSE